MTKLEEEIHACITYVGQTDIDDDAEEIAELVKEYIEKAYMAGALQNMVDPDPDDKDYVCSKRDEWLKANGVIE